MRDECSDGRWVIKTVTVHMLHVTCRGMNMKATAPRYQPMCLLASPQRAYAGRDVWEWLERLSGPEPFHGLRRNSRLFAAWARGHRSDSRSRLRDGTTSGDARGIERGYPTTASRARIPVASTPTRAARWGPGLPCDRTRGGARIATDSAVTVH
jgi:hypothetical protein